MGSINPPSFMRLRTHFMGAVCGLVGIFAKYSSEDPTHHIDSARLYGNIYKFAYWYVDLMVGTPPQLTSVIVDTGSRLCAFPGSTCDPCGSHIDPPFNLSKSETGRWLKCVPGHEGEQGICSYSEEYAEGSSVSGYFFEDVVQLRDLIDANPPFKAMMGCHFGENGWFMTQKANGVLGLSPQVNRHCCGVPSLLTSLLGDTRPPIFAICLAEWGGQLTLGGYNASIHTKNIFWIRMKSVSNYEILLKDVSIGGVSPVNFKFRKAVAGVDSGSTFTYLPQHVYKRLREQVSFNIESHCKQYLDCGIKALPQKRNPNGESVDCWFVASLYQGLHAFPIVNFTFTGGVSIQWAPRAYLSRQGQSSVFCSCYANYGMTNDTILGSSFMLHYDVIFDLDARQIGFARAACPEHFTRPGEALVLDGCHCACNYHNRSWVSKVLLYFRYHFGRLFHQSEYEKHRPKRAYFPGDEINELSCDIPGCPHTGKNGFMTQENLDLHKATVHPEHFHKSKKAKNTNAAAPSITSSACCNHGAALIQSTFDICSIPNVLIGIFIGMCVAFAIGLRILGGSQADVNSVPFLAL